MPKSHTRQTAHTPFERGLVSSGLPVKQCQPLRSFPFAKHTRELEMAFYRNLPSAHKNATGS